MKASIFSRKACRMIFGGVIAGFSLFASQGFSASIEWGSATTIAGDTDVSTNGSLVAAYNFAGNASTLNGVLFSANWTTIQFFETTDSPVSLGSGDGSLSFSFATGALLAFPNTFNAASPPHSGLSPEYQALLAGAVFKDIYGGVTDGFTMTWGGSVDRSRVPSATLE